MFHTLGDKMMLHDLEGKKHSLKIIEAHEFLTKGKFTRVVTGQYAKNKLFTFHEYHDGFFNWEIGFGLTHMYPEPKPIKKDCIVEFENKNPNDGAVAKYILKVIGMFANDSNKKLTDPYYHASFACEVLTAKRTTDSYNYSKMHEIGDYISLRINQLGKVIKDGIGFEFIPYRLYMTKKEENQVYTWMGINY